MAEKPMKVFDDQIVKKLNNMVKKFGKFDAMLNRDIIPLIQQAQADRWKTEGASEGDRWAGVSGPYAAWKTKAKMAHGLPIIGGGSRLMILTGRLAQAAVLKGHSTKKVEAAQLLITISLPYAGYVNDVRNFTSFGKQTKKKIKAVVKKWGLSE